MAVPPPSYNHAAIYETSEVTLTSVNASNNHNLQGINAGRSIITPMIAHACVMHSHVYLQPCLYTTYKYITCTYDNHTYNTVIVGPYSCQLYTTTHAIFHTQGTNWLFWYMGETLARFSCTGMKWLACKTMPQITLNLIPTKWI